MIKLNPVFKSLTDLDLNWFLVWNEEEMGETLSELEGIADVGMALTAYAKLQYVDISEREREELTSGLKKYCELDTLAMVMIYEHFREVV